jgi:hypothetical protein
MRADRDSVAALHTPATARAVADAAHLLARQQHSSHRFRAVPFTSAQTLGTRQFSWLTTREVDGLQGVSRYLHRLSAHSSADAQG